MITIAITIEEAMLKRLRELKVLGKAGRVAVPGGPGRPHDPRSLSALVREALREYLDRREKAEREHRDRAAFARHRDRLRREAEALVEEQAKP
jgi:hypothetical protein